MVAPNSQVNKATVISCMVWSLIAGAGELWVIRLMQLESGSGHPAQYPMELLSFFGVVEGLLSISLFGILRRDSWPTPLLTLTLTGAMIVSIVSLAGREWAPDFRGFAVIMEAMWLGPWAFILWHLWSQALRPVE